MAGFRLIDTFIASDGINPQTRKLFHPAADSSPLAIGDIVSYAIVSGQTADSDKGLNGRYVVKTPDGTTGVNVAGIVVGFTELSDPLSNSSGLAASTDGFVIVNTGINLVYSGVLDSTTIAETEHIVGSSISFNPAVATLTSSGIFRSNMTFAADSIATGGTLPFRIEWSSQDDPDDLVEGSLIYARLQINELNLPTGIAPD